MRVGPRRVQLDQAAQHRLVVGPQQVAHEQNTARGRHAHHLGQHRGRLRDVMHDAVGDHGPERAGGEGQLFGVATFQTDALLEASPRAHIDAAHRQHLLRQIDGGDEGRRVLTA